MSGRSTPVTSNIDGAIKSETPEAESSAVPTVEGPPPPPPPAVEEGEGEATLLVSEFPPPPYYYALAYQQQQQQNASAGDPKVLLPPPPIPHDALAIAAEKAAQIAADAAEAAEAERFASLGTDLSKGPTGDSTEGANGKDGVVSANETSIKIDGSGKDAGGTSSTLDEDVVAVFGEFVEDPILIKVNDECNDPKDVQKRLNALNKEVLTGFVKLVNELVHNPLDNKRCRDEVSHNLFLMMQESNKFREHQARELLIEVLQKQVKERRKALEELNSQIASGRSALDDAT